MKKYKPVFETSEPYIGDTLADSFTVKQNGVPADLSADTFTMRIEESHTGTEFITMTTGDGITNTNLGVVTWIVSATKCRDFVAGRKYRADIQWTRADGVNVTLKRYEFTPYKDITPPA